MRRDWAPSGWRLAVGGWRLAGMGDWAPAGCRVGEADWPLPSASHSTPGLAGRVSGVIRGGILSINIPTAGARAYLRTYLRTRRATYSPRTVTCPSTRIPRPVATRKVTNNSKYFYLGNSAYFC
jgi:hypothetical protein